MPDHPNVRFALKLADGTQTMPDKPVKIPGGSYMIWPFNMDLNGTLLKSATVQPLCRLDGPVPCFVFFEIPGVTPQFNLENGDVPNWSGAPWFTVRAADGRDGQRAGAAAGIGFAMLEGKTVGRGSAADFAGGSDCRWFDAAASDGRSEKHARFDLSSPAASRRRLMGWN